MNNHITMQIHSDKIKLRRFAMQLYFAGDLRRYVGKEIQMNYWRMQLHPDDAENAGYYANQSIAAGFIGLDFATEVGDLLSDAHQNILATQKDYVDFAKNMSVGDKVLIIVHHFPFAVVTVDGEYNYIRRTAPELGVWFRHFRRIKDTIYFSDFKTNAKSWEQYIMTDTISILRDTNSKSYRLIQEMTK